MDGFSFEDVKRAWLAEKTSNELVDLPEEFYQNVARYVAELNRELKRGEELRQELLQEEFLNALRMVQETHLLRVIKSLDEIKEGKLPSPLLERERYAFGEVRQILEKLRAELVAPAVGGETALARPRELTNMALIIQAEVPQIVGDDLQQYGPFESGEVVSLPKRSAEVLVKRGLARKVEVKI